MKPKRILYHTFLPGNILEYTLLKCFSEDSRFDLYVSTCEPAEFYPGVDDLAITVLRSPESRRDSRIRGIRRMLMEYRHWRSISHLRSVAKSHNIDLMIGSWLTRSGYECVRSGFRPVVIRTWGSDVLPDPYASTPHSSRYLRRRAIAAARGSDAIISDAQVVVDTLVELAEVDESLFHLIPSPSLDTSIFVPRSEQREALRRDLSLDGRFVLFCHRHYAKVYDHETLIRALPHVVREHPDVLLLLLGKGPLYEALRSLTVELGMENHVRFMENRWYEPDEVASIMSAIDVYVSTAVSDSCCLSVWEAQSCGCPVVVADAPALLERIKEGVNGFIGRRGDPQSIGSAICRAIQSDSLATIGDHNRELAVRVADIRVAYEHLASACLAIIERDNVS